MHRRGLLQGLLAALSLPALHACHGTHHGPPRESFEVALSLEQWRELLPPERYAVLFEEATERPYSSPLNDEERDGIYLCAACHQPLFDSRHKYDSGTGWPSFTRPLPDSMGTRPDYRLLVRRTEYHCRRCGGHQGHVFDDGPPPRGQRWCNNGLALIFVAAGEELPPLRG